MQVAGVKATRSRHSSSSCRLAVANESLCHNEEVQSPPPNVVGSDPNDVKKEEHEFDEEEKVEIASEDVARSCRTCKRECGR